MVNEVATNQSDIFFAFKGVWPLDTVLDIPQDKLTPMSIVRTLESYRIDSLSTVYPGGVLKTLPSEKLRELESIQRRSILQNCAALSKLEGADGRVPRLLAKGVFQNRIAYVETFLPGVFGDEFYREFTKKLPAVADRIKWYYSLVTLYRDNAKKGVVETEVNEEDFALLLSSGGEIRAGRIDFGNSYIDGSRFNRSSDNPENDPRVAETDAVNLLANFMYMAERREVVNKTQFGGTSRTFEELLQIVEGIK